MAGGPLQTLAAQIQRAIDGNPGPNESGSYSDEGIKRCIEDRGAGCCY
jgi:hypothetical protein